MEGQIMFFHVILTSDCDLQCTYCFGEASQDTDGDFPALEIDYNLPRSVNYDVEELIQFCSRDPHCVLTFYGGEPLLRVSELKRIMDDVPAEYFMIQTNGLHLSLLDPEYLNRLHTILVSIDGDEETTDFYRGKGTFSRVLENLRLIRRNGFEGELIARMTVMEQTDICNQVKWLLNNDEFRFSSVHWQLNAGFWKNDFARRRFKEWCDESYNPGISNLAKFWVDTMSEDQVVIRLYPLLGVANSLLFGDGKSHLRCGGGWTNYAIQTDGWIVPCPTMWGIRDYYVGHIKNANPLELRKVFVGDPCPECDIFSVCGGRCLYANIIRRWDSEAYSHVCNTVQNLVRAVEEQVPRIQGLIQEKVIDLEDFHFLKYNGCEIIP